MRKATIRSIHYPSRHPSKCPPLWLLAAAICLCPAVAQALDGSDTATGNGALASENGGSFNTADGFEALNKNTTGVSNTAAGADALSLNTTGSFNTASGASALLHNTTGTNNTASGFQALDLNTTGSFNNASGEGALANNTTGSFNNASGVGALVNNTIGKYNVADGYYALAASSGSSNVAVGSSALYKLSSGSANLALGTNAGNLTTSGSNDIYIGHPGISGTESNVMRIGKSQTKTFIAGIKGVPLSGATVVVNATGQLGVVASSARYKQDISSLDDTSGKLALLRPVSYRYKAEPEATHYGLIAEEVDKVMPELVVRDDQNRPESVQYLEIIPLLVQDRQELKAELARQRALIEQQAATLAALRRTLATRLATLDGRGEAAFK